ncbi:MAG: hypothetical protein ACJKSS_00720 [Patescibacteria group bacterium UBA2103]
MQTFVRLFSALVALSLISVVPVSAQVERSFDFEINPMFPEAGDTVTVYAETYSFDISRANTTWRVNGNTVSTGKGVKSINVTLGEVGETTSISFSATRSGETISHTTTITPSVIDLIVEPNTYTPPLYKGRALPTHEAGIRVVAIPFLPGNYATEDLIFTWRVDGQILGSESGPGKNVLETTAAPITRRTEIRVDIESPDGKVQARKVVSLKTQQPEVLLYANNPLLGLSTATILANTSELNEEEVTINAEPFYFPGLYRNALAINYTWKLNGKTVESTNTDPGTITLRQAGNGRGKAQVSVSIEHPQEVTIRGGDSATFTFGIENSGLFNF